MDLTGRVAPLTGVRRIGDVVARRLASAAVAVLPESMTASLHDRLMAGGMYADERWIEEQLAGRFAIESLERFSTDVHLHGRVVARKAA